jgi:hypothetical protein
MIATGYLRNAESTGTRSRRSALTRVLNTGVSSIASRRYSETASSGKASRNGMRQPQESMSSPEMNSGSTISSAAVSVVPIGDPSWGSAA